MQGTQILKLAGQYLMFSVHTKVGVILIFSFFFFSFIILFPLMYIVEKGKLYLSFRMNELLYEWVVVIP